MSQIAKLFINGKSQAVRLPVAYRFDTKEVFIRRDEETGDVILSRKPESWDDFLAAIQGDEIQGAEVPADFLSGKERAHGTHERDPLAGWIE